MSLLTPPANIKLTPICYSAQVAASQIIGTCTRNVPDGITKDSCLCKNNQLEAVYGFCSPSDNEKEAWYPGYLSDIETRSKSCAAANLPIPTGAPLNPPDYSKLSPACYTAIFAFSQIQTSCTRGVPSEVGNACVCKDTQLNAIYENCNNNLNDKAQWYPVYSGAVSGRSNACVASNLPIPDGITNAPPADVNVTPLCYSATTGFQPTAYFLYPQCLCCYYCSYCDWYFCPCYHYFVATTKATTAAAVTTLKSGALEQTLSVVGIVSAVFLLA
ncbi:hypothetical protein BDR26DRAFT_863733 [Obelidium mucronatum]|nr:hypothetical protein BDR26DRAFT_863733 [Obelidium mucronatum]